MRGYNKIKNIIFFFVIGQLLFIYCKPSNNISLTDSEIIELKNKYEKEFTKEKEINGYTVRLKYLSAEMMAINEINNLDSEDVSKRDSIINTYKGSEYFILSISNKDESNITKDLSEDYESYSNISKYMSFDVNNDVFIAINNDTLYPSVYHHEKDYELAHKQNFIFAFPLSFKMNDNVCFVYDDKLMGLGRVKFTLKIDKNVSG